ncbi:MAG: MlaD family protein [Solirubrobacteraceae bacterium]
MIDRGRLTERINLSMVSIELKRAIQPLIVLAVGFVVAGAAGYYIVTNINGGIGSTHTMRFEVADATGVVPGRAEVRFYGIEAGQITDVTLVHGHAVLTATVADKFGPVFKDAIAAVRPNTALQDMYLDIVSRGTPGAGAAGSGYVVPMAHTRSPVNLASVLNAFQPDVRTQLYNMLNELGNGLQDRGAYLRQAFTLLAPFLRIAGNVAGQLAYRATLTKQLVHNASLLSSTLASRSTQLHTLITSGTSTLQALSTQGGAPLQNAIRDLPQFALTGAQTIAAVGVVSPPLWRALDNLRPVVANLSSGLDNLRALARSANPAVVKLQQPVVKLTTLADQLQPFSRQLAASLQQIQPQVSDVNALTKPLSQCTQAINEFFNWDQSMAKWRDSLGPMVRGNVNFGFYSAAGFKQSTYTYGSQCGGGVPIGGIPTPKYPGPAPAP